MGRKKLKLSIDMVPGSSWGMNLRKTIGRYRWDKLRKQVHEENGHKCEICDSPEKLYCHEKWEYDEKKEIQKLVGLGSVCYMCHSVMHWGRTNQLTNSGYPNLIREALSHFLKVNRCTIKTFLKNQRESSELFVRRSSIEWDIDFGEYEKFIPKK